MHNVVDTSATLCLHLLSGNRCHVVHLVLIMNNFYLDQAGYESKYNSWAMAASHYSNKLNYPVHYEGIDWTQACKDHGFIGAIAKVKAAYRLRQYQRRLG